MDEKWSVEFGYIVASRYVQVYPLGERLSTSKNVVVVCTAVE